MHTMFSALLDFAQPVSPVEPIFVLVRVNTTLSRASTALQWFRTGL